MSHFPIVSLPLSSYTRPFLTHTPPPPPFPLFNLSSPALYCPPDTLDMLPFLDPDSPPASSTLRSKNPAHRSANDSLPDAEFVSEKKSVLRAGELGVRWKGEVGSRSVWLAVPGLARPACSLCSSVQFRRPAMTCNIWNFLGSDRSRERNCKKWFVTICLLRGGKGTGKVSFLV